MSNKKLILWLTFQLPLPTHLASVVGRAFLIQPPQISTLQLSFGSASVFPPLQPASWGWGGTLMNSRKRNKTNFILTCTLIKAVQSNPRQMQDRSMILLSRENII